MTAPIPMHPPGAETSNPKKASGPATSASLSLTDTNYHQIVTWTPNGGSSTSGGWLDIGNCPSLDMTFAWTHDTGNTLSILAIWSNGSSRTADPTVGAPSSYIPSVAATGVSPAYPNVVTFAKGDWTTTLNPLSDGSTKIVRALFFAQGQRLVTFYAKVDGGTASLIAYASPSTQS